MYLTITSFAFMRLDSDDLRLPFVLRFWSQQTMKIRSLEREIEGIAYLNPVAEMDVGKHMRQHEEGSLSH